MSKGKPRDRGKEQFWRQTIQQWQASGWTIRAFCQHHGVSEANFHAWRRTLELRDRPAAAFVPVRIVGSRAAAGTPAATGLEVVAASGHVVRVGPDFDAATLRRLLAALEEARP